MKTIVALLLTTALGSAQYYKAAASRDYLLVQVPDAAAAYTVDPTTSPLAKGVIWTVQRDGDEAEASFTAAEIEDGTLAAWVTAGGTPTDGYLKTWHDVSSTAGVANGNDATQTTRANQPLVVSSGTLVTDNGRPAISFDGSSDYLTAAVGVLAQPNTFASVNNLDTTGSRVIIDSTNASARNSAFSQASGTSYGIYAGTTIAAGTHGTSQEVWYGLFSGASSTLHVNGTLKVSGNANTQSLDGLSIGASPTPSTHMDGTVQTVLFYNSDQSATRPGIENWLNTFFSVY